MWELNGNPVTRLSWTAPTQNTDGTPITQSLTYNLYVDAANVLSFPGELNPDGSYGFPLADVPAIQVPDDYDVWLTAVDEDGDESAPSGTIVLIRVPQVPLAPADFSAS